VTHITALLAGRYRLDTQIAAGGVGEVWLARDQMLARPVAVKLLRSEYAQHPETRARFRSEAKHAASLTHPAIARVYDYHEGDAEFQPFLVMELVDGPSLADMLAGGPIDPARVMDIVAQAAAGLDAAHSSGLVHRDIKPANLLLSAAGQVKITDFGIAHAAGSAPITRHGQLIGTPAYLAPERVAGQAAGPASDLYSLGILAHECLTGVRPYAGTSIEIALAHSQQALPTLPTSVPAPVAAFITELTAKDPAARPASARLAAARATELRDWLSSPGSWDGGFAAGDRTGSQLMTTEHAVTLADVQPPWYSDRPDELLLAAREPADRTWPRRRVALVVAVASTVAGLAGWLVSNVTAAAPPPTPAASSPPSSKPSHAAPGMVAVDSATLIGQPAGTVRELLRNLGLHPKVRWVAPSDQSQQTGMVVSVAPSGQVPAGSIIIVTAVQSHHHGNEGGGNGNGHGGNGHGNGGD
jgi:eukaryotic-like serine/threonine-protein kinase